jgi:hypothetical protein
MTRTMKMTMKRRAASVVVVVVVVASGRMRGAANALSLSQSPEQHHRGPRGHDLQGPPRV